VIRLGEMAREDARAALRTVRANLGTSCLVVLCLAAGIGLHILMSALADVVFLRLPAGVRNAAGLVTIAGRSPGRVWYDDFEALRHDARLARVAGLAQAEIVVGRGSDAARVSSEFVSADYWSLLGVRSTVGRFFQTDEDRVGARVMVLSDRFWRSRFHADRSIVGQSIDVDGRPVTIVGVAEPGFHGIFEEPVALWLPLVDVPLPPHETLTDMSVFVIARLVDGTPLPAVAAEASGLFQHDRRVRSRPESAVVQRYVDERRAWLRQRDLMLWLLGAADCVLLIAWANAATLMLLRGRARRHQVAIQLALGVTRQRLVRQLLIGSAVLAAAGGGLGILLAWAGLAPAATILGLPAPPTIWQMRLAAYAVAVCAVTTLAFGFAPALAATRSTVAAVLSTGTPAAARRRSAASTMLVTAQFALSLVVLAGAGLFVRSLQKAATTDLGVDAKHVLYVTPDLVASQFDSARRDAVLSRVRDRLTRVPSVRAVAIEDMPRFMGIAFAAGLERPDVDTGGSDQTHHVPRMTPGSNSVSSGYVQASGLRLVRGRDITDADRAGTLPVMVISARLAEEFWPGQDPLGRCLLVLYYQRAPVCTSVVGVVADAEVLGLRDLGAYGLRPTYYVPRAQHSDPRFSSRADLVVRTWGDPRHVLDVVRRAATEAAPEVPHFQIETVPMRLGLDLDPMRNAESMLATFGIVAVVLTAVGLGAVIAYTVVERTREMGIRIAMGARASDVIALVVRQAMVPAVLGIALGMGGAWMATRILVNALYGVSPTDPLTFAVVIGILSLVAVLACVAPARRAVAIDPIEAIRVD
jgi:putative ABC transport system permease protein